MNTKAYEKMNYALAILGAASDGGRRGCIVNSFHQVSSSFPARFTVTVSKDNETCRAVETAGSFCVTLLAEDCPEGVVDEFGYKSSRVRDKFAAFPSAVDGAGNPYLTEHMVSRISCRVTDKLEIGKYILFVGEATEAEVMGAGSVLTLESFTNRGKSTPANATVYRTVEVNGYRCSVCGYVYEGETPPPADYRCPICGAPAEKFVKIEK